MISKSHDNNSKKQKLAPLSDTQLNQLTQAFSDLTKDVPKKQFDNTNTQSSNYFSISSKLLRLKQTFSQIHSRVYSRYLRFASHLKIGKQIFLRPQLSRQYMTISVIEFFVFFCAVVWPKKWVNKSLLGLFVLTVEFQVVEKLLLNYFIEQIALSNNMQPIEQEARNLIEYKYRIYPSCTEGSDSFSKYIQEDKEIQQLMQKIDERTNEYFNFRKVAALI